MTDQPFDITPPEVADLQAKIEAKQEAGTAFFTDLMLAKHLADNVLQGRFLYTGAAGWLEYDGTRWQESSPETVRVAVHDWARGKFEAAAVRFATEPSDQHAVAVENWKKVLGAPKQRNLIDVLKSELLTDFGEFDTDPWSLNTPDGLLDIRTGQVEPHTPRQRVTKITRGSFRPDVPIHRDWAAALQALPTPERDWLCVRLGQAITGETTPDGVLPILQGTGENGKSLFTTDGVVPAFGDYAGVVSPKLLYGSQNDHSTEMADLKGQRLLIAEEGTEDGRHLNVTTIKRIMDVGMIKARKVYKDNTTFRTTHSIFATTNPRPQVAETDHGTWRRLAMVRFPYRFLKPGQQSSNEWERPGDPGLKQRIKDGGDGRHDSIVTWVVWGAQLFHRDGFQPMPEAIAAATESWRADNDQVVQFWESVIEPDPDSCVTTSDLYFEYRRMVENAKGAVLKDSSIAGRFDDHDVTTRHGVTKARPLARPSNISRSPSLLGGELPARPSIYLGLRFRNSR